MMLRTFDRRFVSLALWAILAGSSWLVVPTLVFSQTDGCQLVPDDRNPSEKILKCGDDLSIRSAANTRYELVDQHGQALAKDQSTRDAMPQGARLDSGALLIEFKPISRRRKFQILTPHAIAAVRGTTWAVEVENDRSSTLVVLGYVEVTRPDGKNGVLLRAGQGADVSTGTGPILAKRWATPRVRALLARFGK
jgi:hypothetical protein